MKILMCIIFMISGTSSADPNPIMLHNRQKVDKAFHFMMVYAFAQYASMPDKLRSRLTPSESKLWADFIYVINNVPYQINYLVNYGKLDTKQAWDIFGMEQQNTQDSDNQENFDDQDNSEDPNDTDDQEIQDLIKKQKPLKSAPKKISHVSEVVSPEQAELFNELSVVILKKYFDFVEHIPIGLLLKLYGQTPEDYEAVLKLNNCPRPDQVPIMQSMRACAEKLVGEIHDFAEQTGLRSCKLSVKSLLGNPGDPLRIDRLKKCYREFIWIGKRCKGKTLGRCKKYLDRQLGEAKKVLCPQNIAGEDGLILKEVCLQVGCQKNLIPAINRADACDSTDQVVAAQLAIDNREQKPPPPQGWGMQMPFGQMVV